MSLHGIAAVEVRSRAGTAGNRLVVLQPGVAECQIVHGALGGRQYTQGAVQRIDDALRGLNVAGGYGGGRRRIQQRARRNDHFQRLETALVEWDGAVDESAEHVQHRRQTDGARRVEVVRVLAQKFP